MASMLAVLALTAFASDASAQARRSSEVNRSTSERQSAARSSSSSQTRRTAPSSQTRKSDDNKKMPSKATQAIIPGVKPGNDSKPDNDFKPGNQNKPVQITRPAPNRPQGNNQANRPGVRPDAGPGKPNVKPGNGPGMKPGNGPGKPVQARPGNKPEPPRVHPRERDFMRWDTPSYWWSNNDHCYGYRVRVLPSRARRHVYDGVTYYCYNDIWYRPYKGYYMVCRPPHGLSLAADIISQIAWAAVKISYYNAVADALSQINEPGLTQNYASRDTDYFYQDGVFYSKNAWGEYRVITPPAGALVESLPEDFDVVTLRDGNEYYKVDDTIYKLVISEGRPYFEVVGQIDR